MLISVAAGIIADGRLLDLLRRAYCFGTCLMKLDLRQESARHTQALDAICRWEATCSYAVCWTSRGGGDLLHMWGPSFVAQMAHSKAVLDCSCSIVRMLPAA